MPLYDQTSLYIAVPVRSKRRTQASPGSLPPKPDPSLIRHPLDDLRTVFSEDRAHRFTLFRAFPERDPDVYACALGMNPSTADSAYLDNTTTKLFKMARDIWSTKATSPGLSQGGTPLGGFYMLNALSIRLTKSTKLSDYPVVNLPENDEWIRRIVSKAHFVVVGWGNPGHENGRGAEVERLLREVCSPERVLCFGLNKNKSPVHPLYQAYSTPLVPYFL